MKSLIYFTVAGAARSNNYTYILHHYQLSDILIIINYRYHKKNYRDIEKKREERDNISKFTKKTLKNT